MESFREFSAQEINWGLEFALNECGQGLPFIAVRMMANEIRRRMLLDEEAGRRSNFEAHRNDVVDQEFRPRFKKSTFEEKPLLEAEKQAYRETLGKIFNNRQHFKSADFSPTKRVGEKKRRKARLGKDSKGNPILQF
jgi:hypothetical protein